MMPRFFALNRIAQHSLMAIGVLAATPWSFAGSDTDYGKPLPPPSQGGGGGGGGYLDDGEIDRAAIIAQCGWTGRLPRGNPFDSTGALTVSWQDSYLNVSKFRWSRSFGGSSYNNAMCEMFLLEQVRKDSNGLAKFRDRCESIREDLLSELKGDESGSSNVGNFSAAQAFFGSSGSSAGGNEGVSACDDSDVMSGNERFACRVLALQDIESSPNTLKDYAKKIMADCKKAGADMRRRMSRSEYNSYASSGVHYMGGQCGGGGSGVVVIQQQNKWYDTLANTALGLTKVIAPLWVMNDANKRLNETSQLALKYNKELGFPSGQYAGTGIGGAYGYGGSGYGYGGGGYGYTGHGGACPYGYCGGNGGIQVGGGIGMHGGGYQGGGMHGGGYQGGGMIPGGTCGVPPYAPWSGQYGGCGGGGGGMYNGGVVGNAGSGNPWGAGRGPGGMYAGGTPGFYGPGGAGYNGGMGGAGVGGMPGAWGTLNGGNGWNNGGSMGQWGPGGLYGQTPFMGGGANGYDAQQATLMAQQMQQYYQTIQRQADLAAKTQSRYRDDLGALQKTYGKSYQSYMAAQNASYGLNNTMGGGYMGGYNSGYMGGGYMGGGYSGGGGGGVYYPPYSSGGSGFNLGLSVNGRY